MSLVYFIEIVDEVVAFLLIAYIIYNGKMRLVSVSTIIIIYATRQQTG